MERMLKLPDGQRLSPIGLGTAGLGVSWTDENLLHRYLDEGGNVLDTARLYGWPEEIGRSETLLGDFFARSGRREECVIVSKGGHPDMADLHTPRMDASAMADDLHRSLRALRTDRIDLYLYHRDDPATPAGELLEVMEGFRRAGKIRYYGCSNWTLPRMEEAAAYARAHSLDGFTANECLFNYATDHASAPPDDTLVVADAPMRAWHRANPDCLMLPYSGLAGGFFHKLLRAEDPTRLASEWCYSDENLRRARRLRTLMQERGVSVSQALLGYLLTRETPALPLVSCSSMAHLTDALRTPALGFRPEDFD